MKTIRRLILVLALSLGASACNSSILGPDHNTDGNAHNVDGGNHNVDGGNHNVDGGS